MTQQQEDQFVTMYNALSPKMVNFAGRLCKNRDEAEDVAQEAFIKAFAAYDRVQDARRIDNWLMRIVYNTFLDYRRKQSRRVMEFNETHLELDHTIDDRADIRKTPEELMMSRVIDKDLVNAMGNLDPESRAIFRRVYVDQKDPVEVSLEYGIRVGALRSRLHRIANHLRKDLVGKRVA